MSLYKRNKIWWSDIVVKGVRYQFSTKETLKSKAKDAQDTFKAQLRTSDNLRTYTFINASERWLEEKQCKKSINSDKSIIKFLISQIGPIELHKITVDKINELIKLELSQGKSSATVNRMLAVLRAIFRKAQNTWGWLDKIPTITLLKEPKKRIRYLTQEEVETLLNYVPQYMKPYIIFTLNTGLRYSNVINLTWNNVDLERNQVIINPEESKTGKAIVIPLNSQAKEIILKQLGKNQQFVFTKEGNPNKYINGKSWKKSVKLAGLKDFRWHDLRHTWASWHVQNGTTLQELMELGGWSNYTMVLKYAHLNSDKLQYAATRVTIKSEIIIDKSLNLIDKPYTMCYNIHQKVI